jgi:hypothetical protein
MLTTKALRHQELLMIFFVSWCRGVLVVNPRHALSIERQMPEENGYYQPIVTTRNR